MYVSLLGMSGALHLDIFDQPAQRVFFRNLLVSFKILDSYHQQPIRAGIEMK